MLFLGFREGSSKLEHRLRAQRFFVFRPRFLVSIIAFCRVPLLVSCCCRAVLLPASCYLAAFFAPLLLLASLRCRHLLCFWHRFSDTFFAPGVPSLPDPLFFSPFALCFPSFLGHVVELWGRNSKLMQVGSRSKFIFEPVLQCAPSENNFELVV